MNNIQSQEANRNDKSTSADVGAENIHTLSQ